MARRAEFLDFVSIARSVQQPKLVGDELIGRFCISDIEHLDRLTACIDDPERTGISLLHEDPENIAIGHTVDLQISHPKLGFGIFAPRFSDLLTYPPARVKEPKRYYVQDIDFASGDENAPAIVKKYRGILTLINTLARSSAHLDLESACMLFINDGKFEVPVNYSEREVNELKQSDLDKLCSIIVTDSHSENRLSMLSTAVCELLGPVPKSQRFAFLIEHVAELQQKFDTAYRLFLANFSYDKVRDEMEIARIEYTGKIHKVFSDIQNQVLGIPVATVIVATQMKDATTFGYNFWVNVGVLIGCWVFAILVLLVIQNQRHTLQVLKDEILRQEGVLYTKYEVIADQFSDVFSSLNRRLRHQHWVLSTVDGIVVLGLILAHVLFFEVTIPAHNFLLNLFNASST